MASAASYDVFSRESEGIIQANMVMLLPTSWLKEVNQTWAQNYCHQRNSADEEEEW